MFSRAQEAENGWEAGEFPFTGAGKAREEGKECQKKKRKKGSLRVQQKSLIPHACTLRFVSVCLCYTSGLVCVMQRHMAGANHCGGSEICDALICSITFFFLPPLILVPRYLISTNSLQPLGIIAQVSASLEIAPPQLTGTTVRCV
jgi:hypothetical protein